jgi:hypothetical protein
VCASVGWSSQCGLTGSEGERQQRRCFRERAWLARGGGQASQAAAASASRALSLALLEPNFPRWRPPPLDPPSTKDGHRCAGSLCFARREESAVPCVSCCCMLACSIRFDRVLSQCNGICACACVDPRLLFVVRPSARAFAGSRPCLFFCCFSFICVVVISGVVGGVIATAVPAPLERLVARAATAATTATDTAKIRFT